MRRAPRGAGPTPGHSRSTSSPELLGVSACSEAKNRAVGERAVKACSRGVESHMHSQRRCVNTRAQTLTQGLGTFPRGKRHLFLTAAPVTGCYSNDNSPRRRTRRVSDVLRLDRGVIFHMEIGRMCAKASGESNNGESAVLFRREIKRSSSAVRVFSNPADSATLSGPFTRRTFWSFPLGLRDSLKMVLLCSSSQKFQITLEPPIALTPSSSSRI